MSLWTRTDGDGGKPKYLSDAEKALTFGMDTTEISAGGDNITSVAVAAGATRYLEVPEVTFSGGGGSAVVQYTLVFDDADQQKDWYQFIRYLKSSPVYEGDTTSERLMNFVQSHADY